MPTIPILREPKTIPQRLSAFAKRNLYVWIAFLVPLALMLTAFGLMDVSPFGKADKQILFWRIFRTSSSTAKACFGLGR